ncbi:MAG: tetratricopeptide repeat protein [Actinobacteria bacterium]|nr:tetratricopeptide repeat protein [Actinomycetota bacterium]
MKSKNLLRSLLIVALVIVQNAFAQDEAKSSNLGVGMNLGLQKLFGDVKHTGVGPAGEFMARFLVNDRFNISLGLGYGLLNDGLVNNTFETNLITGDLKANINLLSPGRINPYLSLGLGVFSFSYKQTKSSAIGSQGLQGNRFYDGSFILGGGVEFMATPKLAINVFADYRHTTGDDLDGFTFGDKDGYVNGRAGFTYYLSPRQSSPVSPNEELLATDNLEMEDMSGAGLPETSNSGNLSMFEAKLDKLEESDTGFSMEQYVRLKSRVDELTQLIKEKESALEDLRMNLDMKNQRISDLEAELQRTPSTAAASYGGVSDFSRGYEEALRRFYARDYDAAIREFQSLREQFPHHRLVSNCDYWIGESYFGKGDYTQAADAFQRVFNYKNSYKKDDATIMLGRSYYNMQDLNTAKTFFQELLDNYPNSEYVGKAKTWLGKIG